MLPLWCGRGNTETRQIAGHIADGTRLRCSDRTRRWSILVERSNGYVITWNAGASKGPKLMSAGNLMRLDASAGGIEALMELAPGLTVATLATRRTSLHVLGSMLALPRMSRPLPGDDTLNPPTAAYRIDEIRRVPARESERGRATL
jgi:hypothetical protein